MHILIVSPIPSHPQDQGNSARIFALGRLLQAAGAIVHFLYHPLEGLKPAQLRAMQADWDAVHIVDVVAVNLAPGPEGQHALDGWYDPRVGTAARALHARYHYAGVIANYVWFSGVLEALGGDVLKILDTHDVFGGRDRRFAAAGLAPEWFWTTPAEEARGLARADIVLAIQDHEAAQFRALGHGDVRVLGHLHPWRANRAQAGRARAGGARWGGDLCVGYLASGNPINVASFQALRAAVLEMGGVLGARLLVAGSICDRLAEDVAPFMRLGRVDHVDAFYDRVDLVVNPMGFGTGLKIKSVEAVFEGVALVATAVGMEGLPIHHNLHALPDAQAVAGALPLLCRDAEARAVLTAASAACARGYGDSVRAAAADLWAAITAAGGGGEPGLLHPAGGPGCLGGLAANS